MAETSQRKNTNVATSKNGENGLKAKNIKAFFFDLDNTLISTRVGDTKTCRKLSEVLENQFGFTKDESSSSTQAFLKSFRRCPDNTQTSLDSWRTYLWREALPNRYKHLAEQIYPKWLQLRCKYLALPLEYIQLLKRLRQAGYLLALITNGPSNAQWEKIHKLKVQQYFDCVLVSSDLPWEKPSPHIFHAASNFLSVKPQECVMIGDKLETDIKGGRLAGLGATFWIPLNQADIDMSDVSYPPDCILRNVLDLYKYFPLTSVGNSSSSSGSSSSSSAAMGVVAAGANQNRRCSQISRSTTTSTCNSDQQTLCEPSFPLFSQKEQRKTKDDGVNDVDCDGDNVNGVGGVGVGVGISYKYRRGGSLPTMECFNSEAENSSDSMLC